MAEEANTKQIKLSDYVYVLYKWRKLLFINMFIIIALAITYSLIIPEQFKATSLVMVSQNNAGGMGGIGSLISGSGLGSVGAQLFGMTNPSQDIIFGILYSRTSLTKVIKKFDLIRYYEVEDSNVDRTLMAFAGDIIFEPTENNMIEISVINKDPYKSAEMANYFVHLADSMNIELNIEQARNNRLFIEKRYNKNIKDLAIAEDSMYKFQKKHGIFAVPEQLEASVKAAAEIEAQLVQQEMLVDLLRQQYGIESPRFIEMEKQLNTLKSKVNELKNSSKLSYSSNVLFPFSEAPDLTLNYYRIFREIEIQTKILEFVLPMYEQAKVEEQKSVPSLIVVDEAVPPQLKYSPKRAFIILLFAFFGFFLHLPFIFQGERLVHQESSLNLLELELKNIYSNLVHFYRIRL